LWRVDTHSEYAAIELPASIAVIEAACGAGILLPARLRLAQRTQKKLVNGKSQTLRFAVPVLDVDVTPGQLLGRAGLEALDAASGDTRSLTPVPSKQLGRPIAEQVAEPAPVRESRKPRIVVEDGADLFEGAVVVEDSEQQLSDADTVVVNDEGNRCDAWLDDEIGGLLRDMSDEETWAHLYAMLEQGPCSESSTMPVFEGQLRTLFWLMGRVGLWRPGRSGIDPLHMALRQRGYAHVGDMKKAALVEFVRSAFDAAAKQVKDHSANRSDDDKMVGLSDDSSGR